MSFINRVGSASSCAKVIKLDAAATSSQSTSSTLTWSHTVGSGSNRLLVVGIFALNSSAQPAVSGVTYNGVAMTKVRGDQRLNTVGMETSIWFLHDPPSGAHNVVASITNYGATVGMSSSYAGAQQSSTADAVNGQTGTSAGTKTFTLTTVANNAWVFEIIGGVDYSSAPTISLAAAFTSRGTATPSSAVPGRATAGDTNGPITPAGGVTCGGTISSGMSFGYAITAASFAPAS